MPIRVDTRRWAARLEIFPRIPKRIRHRRIACDEPELSKLDCVQTNVHSIKLNVIDFWQRRLDFLAEHLNLALDPWPNDDTW